MAAQVQSAQRVRYRERYAFQLATFLAIFQTRLSKSKPIGELGRRVFIRAAQQNWLCVRTMMLIVPGRLPLCHQLLIGLTCQPLA